MLCPTVSLLDFVRHTLPFWGVVLLSCAGWVAFDHLHKLTSRWSAPATARLIAFALPVLVVLELVPLFVHAAQPALAAMRCLFGL
jgi:hypothetical protein